MPAYNFMPKMEAPLMAGVKDTTIRAERKDGRAPKAGERFVAYTGMRSKKCRRLFESRILEVSPIVIRRGGGNGTWLRWSGDGRKLEKVICGVLVRYGGRGSWFGLGPIQISQLAERDGFRSASDFFAYFLPGRRRRFRGHLIRFAKAAQTKRTGDGATGSMRPAFEFLEACRAREGAAAGRRDGR